MPVVIIIVAIAVLGAGAFFLRGDDATTELPNDDATEELLGDTPENENDDETSEDGSMEEGEAMDGGSMMEESEDGEAMESEDDNAASESPTTYKDGKYETSITYRTPRQTTHEIDVTVSLQDDVVTAADVVYDDSEGYSNKQQEDFDGGYEELVIGKKLDDVDLGRIGSSSLTPAAFNDAIDQIKEEARS